MRLAIVVPRYGPEIVGGAEAFARQLAELLPLSDFQVEVWTTCTDDLGEGDNVYPSGMQKLNGVPVLRFSTDARFRNVQYFHQLSAKISQYAVTTVEDEYAWIDNSVHSPALYQHIMQEGRAFDLLLFIPYLYGMTYYGASIWPDRTIIWPCLHDEPFAYFLQTRLMLASSRGVMFNSEAELAFARDRLGVSIPRPYVVGGAMDDFQADPARFRRRYGVTEPFLLYAGRLAAAKNVLELVNFFIKYKQSRPGPLKLVLMGKGRLRIPHHPDIVQIGFQSEKDKLDVYAAAMAFVQPSIMESFSIVIMESWLAHVPVLVHQSCDVTRTHVQRSNGGLYYVGYEEFACAVDWFLAHPDERTQMGELGRTYVRRNYNREAVLARFREALALWMR